VPGKKRTEGPGTGPGGPVRKAKQGARKKEKGKREKENGNRPHAALSFSFLLFTFALFPLVPGSSKGFRARRASLSSYVRGRPTGTLPRRLSAGERTMSHSPEPPLLFSWHWGAACPASGSTTAQVRDRSGSCSEALWPPPPCEVPGGPSFPSPLLLFVLSWRVCEKPWPGAGPGRRVAAARPQALPMADGRNHRQAPKTPLAAATHHGAGFSHTLLDRFTGADPARRKRSCEYARSG